MKHAKPPVAAKIKTILEQLAGLARPFAPSRPSDPVAYAAALEVLG